MNVVLTIVQALTGAAIAGLGGWIYRQGGRMAVIERRQEDFAKILEEKLDKNVCLAVGSGRQKELDLLAQWLKRVEDKLDELLLRNK